MEPNRRSAGHFYLSLADLFLDILLLSAGLGAMRLLGLTPATGMPTREELIVMGIPLNMMVVAIVLGRLSGRRTAGMIGGCLGAVLGALLAIPALFVVRPPAYHRLGLVPFVVVIVAIAVRLLPSFVAPINTKRHCRSPSPRRMLQ